MFYGCSSLTALPDGFNAQGVADAGYMFRGCHSLTAIGDGVRVATGPGATFTDDLGMDKLKVTLIGAGFEWCLNVRFEGEWDPSKGIRNVFPNATGVGPGWRVYDHCDGE